MLNVQDYSKLSEPNRAIQDAKDKDELDQALGAAGQTFFERAVEAQKTLAEAEKDLQAVEAGPAYDYERPQKQKAVALAREQCQKWQFRALSAQAGTLRLTMAELSDVEFSREYAGLIHQATHAGRTDSGDGA
jgi:hypothetical protein